ncbi:FkbM family methyltransferase [Anabaena sp. CS-542/02]|uniref:FkbM family methyltransferase n=1 Tax=Anabaena sp. CS-542/02 TaxID=3021719 RepID=UPI00232EFC3D|nr:FkbM family methyltransferase [Anabaena sp. CS-542/02]MDB9447419.1 FkbM family methyltransferase [Anabaena sp. CS-542/02]
MNNSSNINDQLNYLKVSGWLNSVSQKKIINGDNQPIPWYTYPAIEFIEDKVKGDFLVFEFGSGHSTLWWGERVKEVISVESDGGWFKEINQQMPGNVKLNLESDEGKYADFILSYPDEYFDVIIVDGINRNRCLENSLSKVKEDGLIIFDNTDVYHYDSSLRLLLSQGYKRIDFWGLIPGYVYKNCTSVFFKSTAILETNSLPSDKRSCLGVSCMQITNPKPMEMKTAEYDDNWGLNTPVALLIFNRPETTGKVFAAIREAKPPKLLVVADGPRRDKPGEGEKCEEARAIINQVDWECEVLTNYSEVNLGCRERVSSGLDWVFEQVETAIILEDDCLPHPTFFRYCEELLEKYHDDERIMVISGNNFQGDRCREDSYYFSRYGHCWGWASWRRAWRKYDHGMALWPGLRDSGWLFEVLENDQAAGWWSKAFQSVYDGVLNTWDVIWQYSLWLNGGLSILPHVNLVTNIGFGESATHTTMVDSPLANMAVEAMGFPLQHPVAVKRNSEADNFTEITQFSGAVNKEINDVQKVEKCHICESNSYYLATAKILQKYDVDYFQCSHCGFVQTEHPYWLNEAYSEAIALSDVGLVYRNNRMAYITSRLVSNYFDHQAKFLDYGGGYGLFVRLMRDQGFDFYWFDRFCKNIFAQGFKLQELDKPNLALITAFELFEHLENPLQELQEIIDICPHIFFSTELLPENNPTPDQWWYYAPQEGQHISIYTRKSLEILASKYNLQLYTDGKSLHLLTTKTDLPPNLFTELANNQLPVIYKESLLSRDFNQVISKISIKNTSALINTTLMGLKLRDINLIIFPDPEQSEQCIYEELVRVITSLENHPDCGKMTLLVNAGKFPPHLTQAFTEQLCEEEEEGLQISVVGKLSAVEWEALLPRLTGRIVLAQEDGEAVEQVQLKKLPYYELDGLENQLSIFLKVRGQNKNQGFKNFVTYHIKDIPIILPPDHALPQYQNMFRLYDKFIGVLAKHLPNNEDLIVDIGANVGDTTALLLQYCKNPILCIEADADFFSVLEYNLSNYRERITCVNSFISGKELKNVELVKNRGTARAVESKETLIKSDSLQSILDNSQLGKCILLKTDTDGFDFEILLSSLSIIKENSPILFWENEISSLKDIEAVKDLLKELRSINYTKYIVIDNFGNPLIYEGTSEFIEQINEYLLNNKYNKNQTFYYTDIAAFPAKYSHLVLPIASDYNNFIRSSNVYP